MSRNIFLISIFIQYFFIGMAYSKSLVQIGDLKLTGDPQTLTSIEKISIGEHDIEIHQWSSRESLAKVMRSLALQVPSNTLAWNDDDVIRVYWTSVSRSYMLNIHPLSQDRIEFYLSYLHTKLNIQSNHLQTGLLSVISSQSFEQDDSITRIFQEFNEKNERLMDVKDESAEIVSRSMLFVVTYPLDQLEELLRSSLIKNSWSLTELSTRKGRLVQARSIVATRPQKILHMNLVEYFGRSYLYANYSGVSNP